MSIHIGIFVFLIVVYHKNILTIIVEIYKETLRNLDMKRIVAITGFESFNTNLYRQAAKMAMERCEGLEVIFFSDRN